MADLKYLSSDTSADNIIEVLHDDAGVIIDNVLDSDFLEALNNELDPFLSHDNFGRDEFTGFKTKRIGALIARSEKCRELALDPLINESAKNFGESPQILHRDRGIWGGYLPRIVEPLFSTIWAASKFTKENGATQIVPGSHKWDKERLPQPDEIAYAEMDAGSVLIYTGTVLHGGGENVTSDEIRTGVFLHYAVNWIRQEENQYLSCPPEIAKGLSPELRSLIGYSKGGYVLGFYSDPYDDSAKHESVSPENMFSDSFDRFSDIPDPKDLVNKSIKSNQ